MKPAYKHDCDKCTFIGRFTLNPEQGYRKGKKVDVYKSCDSIQWLQQAIGAETTLAHVVRFSNVPNDYAHTLRVGRYVDLVAAN